MNCLGPPAFVAVVLDPALQAVRHRLERDKTVGQLGSVVGEHSRPGVPPRARRRGETAVLEWDVEYPDALTGIRWPQIG